MTKEAYEFMTCAMEMKKKLVEWSKEEMDKGKESVDSKELGEVIDMVKDLAEAEKFCHEAEYYKLVSEAMTEQQMDQMEPMGYNPMHSSVTGRFVSRGYQGSNNGGSRGGSSQSGGSSGYRMGYNPEMARPYIDEYLNMGYNDERMMMGYNNGRSRMGYENSSETESMMTNIRQMWDQANPETRAKLKSDMEKLLKDMK